MISIIITAYKEPKTIGKAIEQVLRNKIPKPFEILVLAPDKETLEEAKKYTKKHKQIALIKDEGKGKPAALNLAFKKAKGDVLVLTDGDVYISDNSILPLIEKLKNQHMGAVSGRPIPQESRNSKYGYWANFLLTTANEERIKRDRERRFILLSGYLFAMRNIIKHIPEDVLDDAFISQLIWKKGYKIAYEPKAEVYIKNPSNLKDWLKQKRRNTSGDLNIKNHLGKIEEMRSFKNELKGMYKLFLFPRNLKEIWFSFELLFARLLSWILGFWDIRIKKKDLKKVWVRVESTK